MYTVISKENVQHAQIRWCKNLCKYPQIRESKKKTFLATFFCFFFHLQFQRTALNVFMLRLRPNDILLFCCLWSFFICAKLLMTAAAERQQRIPRIPLFDYTSLILCFFLWKIFFFFMCQVNDFWSFEIVGGFLQLLNFVFNIIIKTKNCNMRIKRNLIKKTIEFSNQKVDINLLNFFYISKKLWIFLNKKSSETRTYEWIPEQKHVFVISTHLFQILFSSIQLFFVYIWNPIKKIFGIEPQNPKSHSTLTSTARYDKYHPYTVYYNRMFCLSSSQSDPSRMEWDYFYFLGWVGCLFEMRKSLFKYWM